MPSATPDPPPSNVTERRQPLKRKRDPPTSRLSAHSSRTTTPNAYSRRSPPRQQKHDREPAPISDDDDENESRANDPSPPRKLKRPGAGARIAAANREAAETARKRREEEDRKKVLTRQTNATELVAEHYNAVPERGRTWRKTASQIKGLRSLNNWVKSTLIQKFSRPSSDNHVQELCVLDLACGKGGDLGKWEKAPQVPGLYVGCDIAAVSVEQARERWAETLRRNQGRHRRGVGMRAEFYVWDCFGRSVGGIPVVREVGFDPRAGLGGGSGVVVPGGVGRGGFDVVSMMFALHYSFESEILVRGMLGNVAGALKRGGRFIGVMPNSDVISAMVKRGLMGEGGRMEDGTAMVKEGGEEGEIEEDDGWDPEKPADAHLTSGGMGADGVGDGDWDPEKPSEPAPRTTANGAAANGNDGEEEDGEDWDPEKPSAPTTADASAPQLQNSTPPTQPPPPSSLPPLEWGNSLYTVRFPRTQRPLPPDGTFRPPYGWRYTYNLSEAVDNVPEYVVPWEGFRALAEEYGLELMYRKGFREVLEEESGDPELGMLAERMGVLSRDRSTGRVGGLLVGDEELEAAGFYHGFCFYRT